MPKLTHIWIRLCNWVRHAPNRPFQSHSMDPRWSILRISKLWTIKRWNKLMRLLHRTRNCRLWTRLQSCSSRIKQQRYRRISPRTLWSLKIQQYKIKQTQLMALRLVWSISRKFRRLNLNNRDQNLKRLERLLRQSLLCQQWRCKRPKRLWLWSNPGCHLRRNRCYPLVPQQR